MGKALGKTPRIPYVRRLAYKRGSGRGGFTVSTKAVKLLSEGGEIFMALVAKEDGKIEVHPITVPIGTVAVNKLQRRKTGAARIYIPEPLVEMYKDDTRYVCKWDGYNECLILTHEEILSG